MTRRERMKGNNRRGEEKEITERRGHRKSGGE